MLTIEYKVNLLSPARGDTLVARARVIRAGRTITVCQADVSAIASGNELPVAVMVATVMTVRDRPDVRQ